MFQRTYRPLPIGASYDMYWAIQESTLESMVFEMDAGVGVVYKKGALDCDAARNACCENRVLILGSEFEIKMLIF